MRRSMRHRMRYTLETIVRYIMFDAGEIFKQGIREGLDILPGI